MAKQHDTRTNPAGAAAGAAAARAMDPVVESADSRSVLEYEQIAQPVSTAAAAAAARAMDPVVESADSGAVPGYEQISQLAYFYWQARGCPEGSPDEDWFAAEAALRKPAARAAV